MLRSPTLLAVACLLAAPGAAAQDSLSARFEDGFALDGFVPSTAGDRFATVPGARADGHLVPSARLLGVYAYRPLLRRTDLQTGEQREIVASAFTLDLGGGLTLGDLVFAHAGVPFVVAQSGEAGAANEPEGGKLGDLRVGGRARVLRGGGGVPDGAVGLDVWLPTGSQEHLTSDGSVRLALRGSAEGRAGSVAYGASLGYVARPRPADPSLEIGSGIAFSAGAHWMLLDDRLSVGPELSVDARFPREGGDQSLFGGRSTSAHGLVTAGFRVKDVVLSGGFGPGLSDAAGVSPRVILGVTYAPPAPPARGPEPDAPPGEAHTPAPPDATPVEPPTKAAPAVVEPAPATPPDPPAPTEGDPPQQENVTKAREHFAKGVTAYDAGDFTTARREFEAAYALRAHPAVLLNLAQSELRAGDLTKACEHFRQWKAEAVDARGSEMQTVENGIAASCGR